MDPRGKRKRNSKWKTKDLRTCWPVDGTSHDGAVANISQVEDNDYVDWDEYEQIVGSVEAKMENGAEVEPMEQENENGMPDGIDEVEHDAQLGGIIFEFNLDHITADPGFRLPINQFSVNIRSDVRRAFISKGPTQSYGYNFSRSVDKRCFLDTWFKKHHWLEYSVEKNNAYCFYCYLFKDDHMDDKFGYDAFTTAGFDTWKNAYKALPKHEKGYTHNYCRTAYEDFDNQRTSVKHRFTKYTKDATIKYETHLDTSLGIVSLLSLQGEPFRGHDESFTSLNKGNFLEFLDWYKERNEQVKLAFDDDTCPKNAKMTSTTIQKELVECCAEEVTKVIKQEMAGCLFSILIDESRDISIKEQMVVVVRFVNNKGKVTERFLCIKHVKETSSEALEAAIVEILGDYGLHIANLRGQGYDGASNMRGEFNGLQKLIRDENPYAFYVHCFAHQLQLVVVSISKYCSSIEDFFEYVSDIVNATTSSCKRKDLLLDKQHMILLDKLSTREISSSRGKNQVTSLTRPGDTRWGSHYKTSLRIESMWDAVIEVLQIVHQEQRNPSKAGGLLGNMESFSFVFIMKMMLQILHITNELSLILQKKDQNIVQTMSLVIDVKTREWRLGAIDPRSNTILQ